MRKTETIKRRISIQTVAQTVCSKGNEKLQRERMSRGVEWVGREGVMEGSQRQIKQNQKYAI